MVDRQRLTPAETLMAFPVGQFALAVEEGDGGGAAVTRGAQGEGLEGAALHAGAQVAPMDAALEQLAERRVVEQRPWRGQEDGPPPQQHHPTHARAPQVPRVGVNNTPHSTTHPTPITLC